MERDADGPFGDRETLCNDRHGLAFKPERRDDLPLARRQDGYQTLASLHRRVGGGKLGAQTLSDVVQRSGARATLRPAETAQGVHQPAPGQDAEPRQERTRRIPAVAPTVKRYQDVLHDVLGLGR